LFCHGQHIPVLPNSVRRVQRLRIPAAERRLEATLFAPTNCAFAALLEQLGVTAEELLADKVGCWKGGGKAETEETPVQCFVLTGRATHLAGPAHHLLHPLPFDRPRPARLACLPYHRPWLTADHDQHLLCRHF
jgi:hypothetical protein